MNNLTPFSLLLFLSLFFSVHLFAQLKINGLSLVSSNNELFANEVIPLKTVNANFIAVNPFGFIRELNQPNVQYNTEGQWFGETNAGVKQYISLLKKK